MMNSIDGARMRTGERHEDGERAQGHERKTRSPRNTRDNKGEEFPRACRGKLGSSTIEFFPSIAP
jgi:hypothetical protein